MCKSQNYQAMVFAGVWSSGTGFVILFAGACHALGCCWGAGVWAMFSVISPGREAICWRACDTIGLMRRRRLDDAPIHSP